MSQRRFKPTLWPTVFTIPSLIILIALGSWQVHRMNWKNSIIETVEKRISGKPIDAPILLKNIERWRYKRVAVVGTFLHEKEFAITGKPFEGTAGFHLITPLKMSNGKTILVNRGWIPEKLRARNTRQETLVGGKILVEGIIREDKRKGYFVPENEPRNEVWLYVNTQQMAMHRQLGPTVNYFIDQFRKPGPYRLPIGASEDVEIRNEHLQYALTWYFLAISLLIIYFLYHYRTDENLDDI
mgnify:FL=1